MRRILLLCLSLPWLLWPTHLGATGQIAVIVSHSHGAESLSRDDLIRIYERRRRLWNNGAKIVPVNLPADHTVRRQFSLQIFQKPPEDMGEYWDAQYFHGVAPPYVLGSEPAVLQFVANTPGAIGYVTAGAVNGQVKVLMYLPVAPGP